MTDGTTGGGRRLRIGNVERNVVLHHRGLVVVPAHPGGRAELYGGRHGHGDWHGDRRR